MATSLVFASVFSTVCVTPSPSSAPKFLIPILSVRPTSKTPMGSSRNYIPSLLGLNRRNSTYVFSARKRAAETRADSLFLGFLLSRRRDIGAPVRCSSGEEEGETATDTGGEVGNGGDWTTSILLFVFWAGLMYYVFMLAPDQTPSRDLYFLQKLLNLKGDDGFRMNQVLVSLWYVMGLWPLVYNMLLIPSARSSRSSIPVWPFAVMSFFGGAYALIPYFVLWRPPSPTVNESELKRWPLNFLESKITASVLAAASLGVVAYGAVSSGEDWKEFYQYFRESKLVHVTSLDFSLLTAFAPFWVYNDMTSRKWYDSGSWLLPFTVVPLLGPLVYLLLRPSLSAPSMTEDA